MRQFFYGPTTRYGRPREIKKVKTEADVDNDIAELKLKKHVVKVGKNEFVDMGESVGRKNLRSKDIALTEDETHLNKKRPGKKFKTVHDAVVEEANEEVASTNPDDHQEIDDQAEKIAALRDSILNKKTKASIEHFDDGNVASVSLAEDTGEMPEYKIEETQTQDSTLESNPEEWKHLSLKRRAQSPDATNLEKFLQKNNTWNDNAAQFFGKRQPHENLKTQNSSKKERSLRGLLREVLGKGKNI